MSGRLSSPLTRTPPVSLDQTHDSLAVGIDVGGTKIATVATDADDNLLIHDVVPTRPDQLVAQLAAIARAAVARLDAGGGRVEAIGIAVPGHVDPESGTVSLAVNLGAPAVDLESVLEDALGVPCVVEHDVRAAVEWLRRRPGRSSAHIAYLSVGTGIAAGIVTDNRLLRGAHGLAGEVGHLLAQPGGPRCACGLDGCLEAVAAGPAIARLGRAAVAADRTTRLPADPAAADVFRAAAAGDDVALEITDAVGAHLARAIRALVLGFGVDHVIVGGGVAGGGAALLDPILRHIQRERAASALIDAVFATVVVELLPPETEAGARGAAQIARDRTRTSRLIGRAGRRKEVAAGGMTPSETNQK